MSGVPVDGGIQGGLGPVGGGGKADREPRGVKQETLLFGFTGNQTRGSSTTET